MRTNKADLLRGFVKMPDDLLQAGWPLKIDLYRYTPIKNVLEKMGKQGEVLDLEFFLELSSSSTTLILAEEESVSRIREHESISIFDLEFDETA